jgi:hypothetical protein
MGFVPTSPRWAVAGLVLLLLACGSETEGPGGSGGTDGPGGSGGSGGITGDGGTGGGATGGSGGDGGSGGTGGDGGSGGSGGESTLPYIDALEPDHGPEGQPVILIGGNFEPALTDNEVYFNGVRSAAMSIDPEGTRIETAVPGGATTGMVWVLTGGVRVNGPTFTVDPGNPFPWIKSISPNRVQAKTDQTFTLYGTGFVAESRVTVDGVPVTSVTRSPTGIEFSLTSAELSETRSAEVVVFNPAPGGGESRPVVFHVFNDYALDSAVDLGDGRVLLAFTEPPSPSLVPDTSFYSVASNGERINVTSASRNPANPRHVVLQLARPLRDDVEYAVEVGQELESEFTGRLVAIWRKDELRSVGSRPAPRGSGGGPGCGSDRLSGPTGITRRPRQEVWSSNQIRMLVVERTGHQVQILSATTPRDFLGWDGTDWVVHEAGAAAVGCPGQEGSSEGLNGPRGRPVFSESGDVVFVGDTGNGRLQTFLMPWSGEARIGEAIVTGLDLPVLLERTGDELLVAVSSDEVRRYSLDGTILGSFGTHGSGPGQFDFAITAGETPTLAVEGDGAFLVAEPGNHRVHRWRSGASVGWLGGGATGFASTTSCCAAGAGEGWFDRPRGVAVNAAGQIFVADVAGGGRLQKFDASGLLLWEFPLSFEPGGIYIDFRGDLWVTDLTNDRLHEFEL